MRTPCCHSFLAFILKFLNFLQAFVGVAIIVYSAYLLNQWGHQNHQPSAPGDPLPAPWFIYAFMGVGILVCCITFIGHIGAEAINGCCLCFYAILVTLFIMLEVSLVAFIALDHTWEKDIPFDPTGELDRIRAFIEDNFDVFMWAGIAIVVVQVSSLLFALILRSLVSDRREDDDIDGDYDYRTNTKEPLLAPYSSQASVSSRGDSDIWSSRMRQKYGLNSGDSKSSLLSQNPSVDAKNG